MQQRIHDAFLNGVQTVFTTLFNDGVNDGINLYLINSTTPSMYRESKFTVYECPVLLTAKIVSSMGEREADPELSHHDNLMCTIPRKDMLDKGISCTTEDDFDSFIGGYVEYHGSFYRIYKVQPRIYVEDAFMALEISCERDVDVNSLPVVPEPEAEDVDDTENDG